MSKSKVERRKSKKVLEESRKSKGPLRNVIVRSSSGRSFIRFFVRPLVAVKVVARNNIRAPLRILVRRTISRVIATLDTSPRASRLYKLDIVFVAQALATSGVPVSACSTGGVVLASGVVGVETGEVGGVYAAGD